MESYLEFIYENRTRRWYQPVILHPPDIIEIRGLWHEATKSLAEKLFKNIDGKTVLDVGCNTGFFLQEAYRRGASRLVGIDSDIEVIRLASEIATLLEMPLELNCRDAMNFSENTFDVVLMMNVLDYVPNPTQCINKYLNIAKSLIIEHEICHKGLFPCDPSQEGFSERSDGRILSVFGLPIDI